MLNLLLLLMAISVIFHLTTRYSRKGRLWRKIPGPEPMPIFGNLFMFFEPCLNKFWEIGREVNKTYYPISKYLSLTKGIVNVYHPDDLEIVFLSQKVLQKGLIYYYLQPWLKRGLLTTTGEKWRQRRKILTPAFHFGVMKKYMEIAREEAEKFIETLKENQDNETIYDLMDVCSNYTLNVICEAAMGVKLANMEPEVVNRYKSAIYDMGRIVLYRIPRLYINDWTLPFFPNLNKLQKRTIKTLHAFSKNIIDQRVEYHKQNDDKYLNEFLEEMKDKNGTMHENIGLKKRMSMLDLLLAAKKNGLIDDRGIQEEVDTFTFEGHDTTGMALVYTIMLLAEHKDAQERARYEIIEILNESDGKIDNTDMIKKFNYLERCIKESLRLYPAVSTVLRYASEDIKLKHAYIPAGTQLVIHLYDTHRDPNFWTNPDKFDPDRFLPENSKNRHPFAYVPFAAGPRNCIGQKFAMMEMKYLLARLLYDFQLESVERLQDMKLTADIVMRPFEPVHVKFIRIKK